jgi:undecaprenyl-diphosphatase
MQAQKSNPQGSKMQLRRKRFAMHWRSETWLVLTIAVLLFAFGLVAQEVSEGESMTFDRDVMFALRNPANPSVPVGPVWLQETARDVTSLGSTIVLGIITFAVVGYLFLARRSAVAWLMLSAVLGGVALNNLLKFAFARPRPDFVTHAARVFTTSFPSGHATLSAITYLTVGALLARIHPSLAIRIYLMLVAVFLILLIGMSRIYLGVHYPTDVLGGWCVGAAWAMGCWVLMVWLQNSGQVEPPEPDVTADQRDVR